MFLHSFWLLSVLKPSWYLLWVFGWWCCGQGEALAGDFLALIWAPGFTALGPPSGYLHLWGLVSSSTDFYLVLHIILEVFASYTWFMALWPILTYFIISNICLNPVDASILKIGFVCSSHGHTALFSLHQPCLSFPSLYFQFLFCLRCIFCKQYWVFNPIRDCVFWKRNPPNSHLCGTCHIGLFLPFFWLYVLLFPFFLSLLVS